MAIKKVEGGWEYDGILWQDYDQLLASIEAEKRSPGSSLDSTQKLKFVYDDSQGEDCLGYYVARYLEKPHNSISKLAKSIGVSRETIYKWIEGSQPSAKNIPKVSEVLGVSIERLVAIYTLAYSRKLKQEWGLLLG